MSRNGTGTYNLPAGNPVIPATTISTTWANTTLTDIASALTGSVASDGQTPMTANLNMANNRIISVADPVNAQDAATKAYVDANPLFLLKASNLSDVANATTSRTNLSAAKSGANSDITSITGLTTPLTVAQGGTGAATLTANNVLLGNGTSAPQVVAPSTSGNFLRSNGTTWVSEAVATGSVTSVATGNGLSGGTITSTGTLVVACPAFNTVGSYCMLGSNFMDNSTYTSGSNYSAGTGSNQLQSVSLLLRDGDTISGATVNNLSGTWKWMAATGVASSVSFQGPFTGIGCRVS